MVIVSRILYFPFWVNKKTGLTLLALVAESKINLEPGFIKVAGEFKLSQTVQVYVGAAQLSKVFEVLLTLTLLFKHALAGLPERLKFGTGIG